MPELHQLILDRIEENQATLENEAGEQIIIPAHWLPAGTKPGEVLDITNIPAGDQSTITFMRNQTATEERQAEMRELRAGLKKGPSGDIKL